MYIKQLEYFVNLAETLNFSTTADLLYVTQPTVTHAINNLEEELRVKLFIRTKRKVELTPAGLSLYHDMADILTRTNIAISKAREYSKTFESSLLIGYEGNVEVAYLPEILRSFKERFPRTHIYLKIADFKEKRKLFTNYNFDLIFTVKESIADLKDTSYLEVYTGHFVCVLPKKHPMSVKEAIEIEELKNEALIFLDPIKSPSEMTRIQKDIQLKCPDSIVYFSDSALISYAMIKGGIGIAVMPDFVCPKDADLAIIPMSVSDSISYGIAWHQDSARKEVSGFVHTAVNTYKNLL